MPDVMIGRLTQADGVRPAALAKLAGLLRAEWPDWYGATGRANAEADVTAWAHGGWALPLAVVAWRDGEPVGVAALKATSIDSHSALTPWASAGVVRTDLRGRGIGTRLLAALADAAAERGFDAIHCGTGTADAFLRRSGWGFVDDTQQMGQPVRIYRKGLTPALALPAGHCWLRPFTAADAPAFTQAVRASATEIGRWMGWASADYTEAAALTWFDICRQSRAQGQAQELGIFDAQGRLVGGVGLNEIRALHRTCNLGYWLQTAATGHGAASAAARAMAQYAFDTMGMARVEILAAVGNLPSQAVARRCGATWEGTARARLQVRGQAHDAQVFALVMAGAKPG